MAPITQRKCMTRSRVSMFTTQYVFVSLCVGILGHTHMYTQKLYYAPRLSIAVRHRSRLRCLA